MGLGVPASDPSPSISFPGGGGDDQKKTRRQASGRGVRRLAEAVLILSRCQHFLRQRRGRRGHRAAHS